MKILEFRYPKFGVPFETPARPLCMLAFLSVDGEKVADVAKA